MTKKVFGIGVVLALLVGVPARSAHADDWDKSTHVTFKQPIDISGHIVPPGSYWLTLADVNSRHIVRLFSDDQKHVVLTVMTIPNVRLKTTSKTVLEFREVPAGSPRALRAWFYPHQSIGEEFVYPKRRAQALAKASNVVVPAHADIEPLDDTALATLDVFAVTPTAEELPLADAIQATAAAREPVTTVADYIELPRTATVLPGVVAVGVGFLALGLALKVIATRM